MSGLQYGLDLQQNRECASATRARVLLSVPCNAVNRKRLQVLTTVRDLEVPVDIMRRQRFCIPLSGLQHLALQTCCPLVPGLPARSVHLLAPGRQ